MVTTIIVTAIMASEIRIARFRVTAIKIIRLPRLKEINAVSSDNDEKSEGTSDENGTMWNPTHPIPRECERYDPMQKLQVLLRTLKVLTLTDAVISAFLFTAEIGAWVMERVSGSVAGWHAYQDLVGKMLFGIYFGKVIVKDYHNALQRLYLSPTEYCRKGLSQANTKVKVNVKVLRRSSC